MPFHPVPVLPVVVPLHRRGQWSLPRAMVALAVGVNAAGVAANTVFLIFLDKPRCC